MEDRHQLFKLCHKVNNQNSFADDSKNLNIKHRGVATQEAEL